MTFNLKRLAVAGSRNGAFERVFPKLKKEDPRTASNIGFMLNSLAHCLGQNIRTKKLDPRIRNKIAALYDEFKRSQLAGSYPKLSFDEMISSLTPTGMEAIFGEIFSWYLKKKYGLGSSSEQPIANNVLKMAADFGVKLEFWGYENLGSEEGRVIQHDFPKYDSIKLPKNPIILKLMTADAEAIAKGEESEVGNEDCYGFEYDSDWFLSGTREDAVASQIGWHNSHFEESQSKLNALRSQNREKKRKAEKDKEAERKAASDFFAGSDAGDRKSSLDSKRSSDVPDDCDHTREGLSLGGTPSFVYPSSGTSGSPSPFATGIPPSSTSPVSPLNTLFSNLSKAIAGSNDELINKKTGNFTIKGILMFLIVGVMELASMFSKFGSQAAQAYKTSHPGRPLEPDEIVDDQDDLFNRYVSKLSKEQEKRRENLTSRWRTAALAKDAVTKGLILDELKGTLLNANNFKALDDLRFDQYLSKIQNLGAKDSIRRQVSNKNKPWALLSHHLYLEGSYIEADQILQHVGRNQLQVLSKHKEFQEDDLVETYQQALDTLVSINVASLNKAEQQQHCIIRNNLMTYLSSLVNKLEELDNILAKELHDIKKPSGISEAQKQQLCKKHEEEMKARKNQLKQEAMELLGGDPWKFMNTNSVKEKVEKRPPSFLPSAEASALGAGKPPKPAPTPTPARPAEPKEKDGVATAKLDDAAESAKKAAALALG